MLNILICDDEPQFADELYTHVKAYMDERGFPCRIDATQSPTQALKNGTAYHLAFLDVQMDEMDGISLAKALKQRNSKIALFFVTNYNKYQDDAMDLRALRYFEKPFDPVRLYAGLDKAMEYISGTYVDVFSSVNGEHKRTVIDDIVYIMRDNRRVVMVTKDGAFTTKQSFDWWREHLPSAFFCHVHNAFLVNLHYVGSYSYTELTLTDSTVIPIASRKQAAFRKFWFDYLRRR